MEDTHREMNFFDLVMGMFRGVSRLFVSIGRMFGGMLRLTVRYWWAVLVGMAIFIVIGLYATSQNRRVFYGETTLLFAPEARPIVISHLQLLGSYCHSPLMQKTLHLDSAYAASVHRIKYYNLIDFKNDGIPDIIEYKKIGSFLKDTFNVVMPDRINIRIYMYHENDFQPIQEALLRYFSSLPEMQRIDSVYKAMIHARIELFAREKARIDSAASIEYLRDNSTLAIPIGEREVRLGMQKQFYYTHQQRMIDKQFDAATKLAANPNVVDFISDMPAASFPRSWAMIIWTLGGYVAGALLALCIKMRREIKTYLLK